MEARDLYDGLQGGGPDLRMAKVVGLCGTCLDRHGQEIVDKYRRLGAERVVLTLVDTQYGFCQCKCHGESLWDKDHHIVRR